MKNIHVLVITYELGCASYIILTKKVLEYLEKTRGVTFTTVTPADFPMVNLKEYTHIINSRCFDDASIDFLIKCKEQGLPIIFINDDNYFALYFAYKDGNIIAVHKSNQKNKNLLLTYKLSDVVLAFSQKMYDVAKHIGSMNVFRLNTVQHYLDDTSDCSEKQNGTIVIGYIGTLCKDIDFTFVTDAINGILHDFDHTSFEFIGFIPKELAEHDRVKHFPCMDYDAMHDFLKTRHWDIALAPLADTEFNKSKTNTKFREYSAHKICGIYSNIVVYSECIENGKTGILAENTPDAWYAAMKTLIFSYPQRKQMAESAFEYVKNTYSIEIYANQLYDIFIKFDHGSPLPRLLKIKKFASLYWYKHLAKRILPQGSMPWQVARRCYKLVLLLSHPLHILSKREHKQPVHPLQPGCCIPSTHKHIMFSSSNTACIIVNFNGMNMTLACLEALYRLSSPPRVICVVDNGSRAGESDALLRGWTEVCHKQGQEPPRSALPPPAPPLFGGLYLPLAENTGFAGGNNAALRLLLTDPACNAFWLLNNDTEPHTDALAALLRRMNQSDAPGMVGSTLVHTHEPRLQAAAGTTLSPLTGITRFVLGDLPLSKLPFCNVDKAERTLACVTGASCLVHREGVAKVGLMDEGYFLYYEDADWSLMFKKGGYILGWAPESVVLHAEGGSSGPTGQQKQYSKMVDYLSYRNRLRFVLIHFPLAVPTTLLSFAYACCKRLFQGEWEKAWLVIQAARSALRGEQGKPTRKL